uniref:FSA_C domain-containing protein n=1 Tax=Steinernema glaseri TaxID=37863 RepID=A0A1I7XZZ8_9BILA
MENVHALSDILQIDNDSKLLFDFQDVLQDINIRLDDQQQASIWQLIGCCLLFMFWIVFISFYFSRLLAVIIGSLVSRYMRWSGWKCRVRIGSLSVSILAGKIMFRQVVVISDDLTVKCNDGWIIFSYWRPVGPKKSDDEQDMKSSRLHISLNGLKIHVYNRLEIYRQMARRCGLERLLNEDKEWSPATNAMPKLSERELMKIDKWWNKFWQLTGLIKLDISSGRFVAGNQLIPTLFVITFENMQSKLLLTSPTYKAEDRFMFNIRSNAEHVKVSLVKNSECKSVRDVDPPRTMGQGFAIIQTASVKFFYSQDMLGFVRSSDVQSLTENVPTWESVWRFGKNTVISYGPWADHQRQLLYSFFFPHDYIVEPVTELPKRGQRRIYLNHNVRILLEQDAGVDVWFMIGEDLNALHSRVKHGSSFEFSIPWTTSEDGFTSTITGNLFFVETTTSMFYRELLSCERFIFNLTLHYPRVFNSHQQWDFNFELSKTTAWIVWDHKRFFTDLLNEWTKDTISDLCSFVPYTCNFNLVFKEQFEIILFLNENNWIDTSSSTSAENFLAALVGKELSIKFALPFIDFSPKTVPVSYEFEADDNLALRVRLSPQSAIEPLVRALSHTVFCRSFTRPSNCKVRIADPANGWIEIWRTERVAAVFHYVYHPQPGKFESDIPMHVIEQFMPQKALKPATLTPDRLAIDITICDSEVLLSGIVIKAILELKNNYFGYYDRLSEVSSRAMYANFFLDVGKDYGSADSYRPMDVTFRLELQNVKCQCVVHSPKTNAKSPDACPVIFTEQLVVELKKSYTECTVQAVLGPVVAHFEPSQSCKASREDSWISLSAMQFRGHGLFSDKDIPWEIGCLEYAWMMEFILGDLKAKLHPAHIVTLMQFVDNLLLLILSHDEKLDVPEKLDYCHHFNNVRSCTKSNLRIMDAKGNIQNCEYEEKLKYKLVRVAVDSVDLTLVESTSAVQIGSQQLRLSFCNAHAGSFCENVVVHLPAIKCKQLIFLSDKNLWLGCGSMEIHEINLDIRLPYREDEGHIISERSKFLSHHDASTKRLYFLYPDAHIAKKCACFGCCRFFGATDIVGSRFLSNSDSPLAVFGRDDNGNVPEQPKFHESIINKGECALGNLSSTTTCPSSVSVPKSSSIIEKPQPKESLERKESDQSFHSACADTPPGSQLQSFGKRYLAFMDVYQIQFNYTGAPRFEAPGAIGNWIKANKTTMKKTANGVNNVKLTKKEQKPHIISAISHLDTDLSTDLHDWGSDQNSIYVRGQVANEINIMLSPPAVTVLECLVTAATEAIESIHPAFLAQKIYSSCAGRHHCQPLTACLTPKSSALLSHVSLHIRIALPAIHVSLFQCEYAQKGPNETIALKPEQQVASMAFLTLEQSHFITYTNNNKTDDWNRKISLEWRFRQCHSQIVQFVDDPKRFDVVYNKIPMNYTVNWQDSLAAKRLDNIRLKPVFDFHIPDMHIALIFGSMGRHSNLAPTTPGGNFPTSNSTRSSSFIDKFNIAIGAAHVTFVLGKSMDSERHREQSLYEVVAPSLTAWISTGMRCATQVKLAISRANQWKDLALIKLFADALDSHMETVFPLERSSMQDVKTHGKALNSCPSCKLMLTLLRFIGQTDRLKQEEYFSRTIFSANELCSQSVRKSAIIALLSHWQTIICSQIQLVDHVAAQKYRAVPEPRIPQGSTVPTAANPTTHTTSPISAQQLPPNSATEDQSKDSKGSEKDHRDPKGNQTSENQPNQSMDLYFWILKAHREYKEKKDPHHSAAPITAKDFNAMEILLSVFFWGLFEDLELESSLLDRIPLSRLSLAFNIQLAELRCDVVEKKMLYSDATSERLVALTCHHLFHVDTFITNGKLFYEMHMDQHMLKAVRANLNIEYGTKVNNIRVVVALASLCLASELSAVVRDCKAALLDVSRTASFSSPQSTPPTSPNNRPYDDNAVWSAGVLDKLHDYQRSINRAGGSLTGRRDEIQLDLVGSLALKNIQLESMLSDLCILVDFRTIHGQHSHKFDESLRRSSGEAKPLVTDSGNLSIKRASLYITEKAPNGSTDSNTMSEQKKNIIFSFMLRETQLKFERTMDGKDSVKLLLGEIEGDMPTHAQFVHDVMMKHGTQLNEQLQMFTQNQQPLSSVLNHDDLKPASTPTVPTVAFSADKPGFGASPLKPPSVIVHFDIQIASLELNALILPSLKAKYRLDKAFGNGKTGEAAKINATVHDHLVSFHVLECNSSHPIDTFTLKLPTIEVKVKYHQSGDTSRRIEEVQYPVIYREGDFYDIAVNLGQVEHAFSTDLLNQILFAEQTFRSELSMLIDRFSTEQQMQNQTPSPTESSCSTAVLYTTQRTLFSLNVKGLGAPWMQLTASTPTSTAVRFTLDKPEFMLTNRRMLADVTQDGTVPVEPSLFASNEQISTSTLGAAKNSPERLYGKASVMLNAKLGQLYKSAMFEEIETELQEFATFMTTFSAETDDNTRHSSPHSYVISVNRPILLIKSSAVDKAILLWLNYKNTYDFWKAERMKMFSRNSRRKDRGPRLQHRESSTGRSTLSADMNMNLSLSIKDGLYVCMPLYSAEFTDSNSVLLVSLRKTDVSVCVRKELACEANFEAFKVTFIENFDEKSLSEQWLQDKTGKEDHSNFFFFPQGSYRFCSSASAPSNPGENAKWTLSVKWQMKGMMIDFDQRIGKLTSLVASTLSTFASGEDAFCEGGVDDMVVVDMEDDPDLLDPELDAEEYKKMCEKGSSSAMVSYLERKMHAQAVLVTDLIQCHASEPAIETERRKLRKYELARFKQFRKSMIDKFRRREPLHDPQLGKHTSRTGVAPPAFTTIAVSRNDPHEVTCSSATSSSLHPTSSSISKRQPNDNFGRKQQGGEPRVGGTSRPKMESASLLKTAVSSNSETGTSGSHSTRTAFEEKVDMNIDVQISIESGSCILRTTPPSSNTGGSGTGGGTERSAFSGLSSKPSSKNLKPKEFTSLSIPSVGTKVFYSSYDLTNCAPNLLQSALEAFPKDMRGAGKNGCFYLALELASMPSETLVTPHLADFLEQVVEPLPPSLFDSASMAGDRAPESSKMEVNTARAAVDTVPIVASIDTSTLPIDLLFYMNVQSSTIRFEGPQTRSTASNCLLTLPRLTLMASTRKYNEQDKMVAGIHLSAVLSKFSIGIYSPHQLKQDTALSLSLDHLSVAASRTKNAPQFNTDEKNRVQLVLTSSIGSAQIRYDIKRLNEVFAFPKPWYRRNLVRRVFFGDHSVVSRPEHVRRRASSTAAITTADTRTVSTISSSALPEKRHSIPDMGAGARTIPVNNWSAAVLFSVQWQELNINAEMATALGSVKVGAQHGSFRGHLRLNSRKHRDLALLVQLGIINFNASKGVISSEITIEKFLASGRHQRADRAPENMLKIELGRIATSLSWMSRPVLMLKLAAPRLVLTDQWKYATNEKGQVVESTVSANVNMSWTDLQMVITQGTIGDMEKIVKKLVSIVEERVKDSRKAWYMDDLFDERDSADKQDDDPSEAKENRGSRRYWHYVLDSLTDIQLKRPDFLPLPTAKSGVTVVGGSIVLDAGRTSLACMNGDLRAESWALFHIRETSGLITTDVRYSFMDANAENVGIEIVQKFLFKLGGTIVDPVDGTECKAVVCRVAYRSATDKNLRTTLPLADVLEEVIDLPLRQIKLLPDYGNLPSSSHSPPTVLELFQFPALEAVLKTVQRQPSDVVPDTPPEEVKSSVICEFHNAVCVQTDFNAQVSFLPELIKLYAASAKSEALELASQNNKKEAATSKDVRKYNCEVWTVDPKIGFIDRFKWNPPVIDDILRKLQIFDHRTTIPKVLQRGVLDHADETIALIIENVLKIAKKSD